MHTDNRTIEQNMDPIAECLRHEPEVPRGPDLTRYDAIHTREDLRRFVSENHDQLRLRARNLTTGQVDEADELLQELYPRMRRMLELNPQGIKYPWAATLHVLARLKIDALRRRCIRQRIKSVATIEEFADRSVQTEADCETVDRMHHALKSLPQKMRCVLWGIFIEGKRAKDVATELGLSESRITELKYQGLQEMRRLLGLSNMN